MTIERDYQNAKMVAKAMAERQAMREREPGGEAPLRIGQVVRP